MPKFVEDSLWQTLPFGRAIVCKLLEGEQKGNMRWRWFTEFTACYCGICKMTIQCERGLARRMQTWSVSISQTSLEPMRRDLAKSEHLAVGVVGLNSCNIL